jgi:hypothetical protein
MKYSKTACWLLALLPVASPVVGQDLIAIAKRVPASSLDSTLPAVPFEQWLAQLSGLPPSAIKWEINDCGEGGDGRAAPTCVEAILPLRAESTAHASVVMIGTDGTRAVPSVWDLSIGAGYAFAGFKTLHEWAARLRRGR